MDTLFFPLHVYIMPPSRNPEKHRWSDGERAKLMELCSGTDMSWEDIAARISELGTNRTGDACRIEFNRMGVGGRQTSGKRNVDKEKWTDEEDEKLQKLYKDYGPQWREISKYFPDRTDSSIRNRLRRKQPYNLKLSDFDDVLETPDAPSNAQPVGIPVATQVYPLGFAVPLP